MKKIMTREIKFRAWDRANKVLMPNIPFATNSINHFGEAADKAGYELMQYTGLKDKNGVGQDVYEGDIVDSNGQVKGNKYEMEPQETDLVIEGMGTKAWRSTEQEAIKRGLNYAI